MEVLARELLDGALKHLEQSRRCATMNYLGNSAGEKGEVKGPREKNFMDTDDVVEDD